MGYDLFSLVEIVLGVSLILWGVASIINKDIMKINLEIFASDEPFYQALSQIILIGILITGIFIVSVHNEWSMSFSIITTLFGWAALIKCFLWLAFKKPFQKLLNILKPWLLNPMIGIAISVLTIVIGLLITCEYIL